MIKNGFALVDVLVSAAVLSVSILAITQVFTLVHQASIRSQRNVQFEQTMGEIHSIVAQEGMCRLALGGPLAFGGALDADAQTLNLNGPTEIVIYQPGATTGLNPRGRRVFLEAAPGAASLSDRWRVDSIQIIPLSLLYPAPTPAPPGPSNVPVRLTLTMSTGPDDVTIQRSSSTIDLSVTTDAANRITTCAKINFGTDQLASPVCPPDHAVFSDGTNLGCRRVRCTPSLVGPSLGFDAQGNMICP